MPPCLSYLLARLFNNVLQKPSVEDACLLNMMMLQVRISVKYLLLAAGPSLLLLYITSAISTSIVSYQGVQIQSASQCLQARLTSFSINLL